MATTQLNEMRKKMFRQFEEQLKVRKPEDSCFYCHSSEDRIVLSHALFWVMTQNIRGADGKAGVPLVASSISVAKTEHSHPLGMVVSTHFRCGKGVKRGLKNGALPFNID